MGSGPSKTTESKSDTTPWAAQQPYLLDAFAEAQKQYKDNMAQGAYQGDQMADPTQAQYDAYGNAVSQGYAAQGANQGLLSQSGQNLTAGSAGALGAMNSLGGIAGTDQTAGNIEKAKAYAAGVDIDGQVQAGMRDANRNASENLVPSIYRTAAASGGINSDRAALSQGVVERGLAEKSMDLRATLGNQAYTTGLSNAQQGNAQQLQALSQQGSIGGGLLSQGAAGTNSGIANQQTINAQVSGGANGIQGLDQQKLNELMQKYNGGQAFSAQQLQNLMGIVGKTNWGASTTGEQTTQDNPSMLQNIGSGVGIAAALFCDRRIKNVYTQTGGSWFGYPEYLFSYRDDPSGRLHKGPMAQDVEAWQPYAVTEIGGVKVILTDLI